MRSAEDATVRQTRGCLSRSCGKTLWSKYAKTAALVYSWTSLGLYSEILGPTLPTLMHQTESNYEQVGLALSIRAVGMLSGSLVGGLVSDKWKRQRAFLVAISLIMAALTNTIIPWIRTLSGLSTILYVAGFSHGFHTTSGNPLLGSVWGSQASGPFSLMHAGYGLGGAIAPILVSPFTIPPTDRNGTSLPNVTSLPMLDDNQEVNPITALLTNNTDSALIEPLIPYNLVALILLLSAVCFIPFAGLNWNRPCCRHNWSAVRPRTNEESHPSYPNQPVRSWFRRCLHRTRSAFQRVTRLEILLICGVFIIFFAVVGNERVFGKFMFTYAIYGPIQMSTRKGYALQLVYWIAFGIARVLTCILALCIPARLMLGLLAIGTLATSVGLTLIPHTPGWFFAFACLFSLFKSPLFPGTLAAINLSHEVTGLLVLVVNLGSSCGASLLQYTAGSLIQQHGQFVFPYLVCGSACVVLLTATGLIIVLRAMGNRFDRIPVSEKEPVDCLIPGTLDVVGQLDNKSDKTEYLFSRT